MKRKTVTVTKEYDKEGNLISETTETVEEQDNGSIYPQYQVYPQNPTWWTGLNPIKPTVITSIS